MKFRASSHAEDETVAAVIRGDGAPAKDWQVRSADGSRSNRVQSFSGADALIRSLKFAHEEYSRVRWLME